MSLSYLLLVIFPLLTVRAFVIFEDCGSEYELELVNIRGCSWSLPCYVTVGDRIPVSLQFRAEYPSTYLDQQVTISLNFVNQPTEVSPDPCEILGCPISTEGPNTFTSVMSIPSSIALNQRGTLRWQVYNEEKRLVLCYAVLVQTQSHWQKFIRTILANHIQKSETLDGQYQEIIRFS